MIQWIIAVPMSIYEALRDMIDCMLIVDTDHYTDLILSQILLLCWNFTEHYCV